MRIYQINSVCGVGSTGKIARDIQDVLISSGDECRIGYGRGFCDAPNCYKFESDISFKAHALFSRITDRQGFYSKAATKRLIRDIESYNPDVIHLHNIHGYYLNIKLLFDFLKQYKKPVVWTLHDCWPFTGHCAFFGYVVCDLWQTQCYNCPQKRNYPASLLFDSSRRNHEDKKRIFGGVDNLTIVTPSAWLADLTKRSFLGEYPVVVIPNGIDLARFKPTDGDFISKNGLQGKKIILGVANIWEPRKGLDDFITLSSVLDRNYHIVLVGLTRRQKAYLPSNVTGICRTNSRRELAELYTAASYFVNLTYEDNFPTTNIEALACGTPVITYRTGGSPESITKKCGLSVPQGDISAVLNAVTEGQYTEHDCLERSKLYDKNISFEAYRNLYLQLSSI